VLCYSCLHLTINLHLCQRLLLTCLVCNLEYATVVFAIEIAFPQRSRVGHKFVFKVKIPIFVFSVELKIVSGIHIIHSQDTIVTLHRHIFHSCYCIGNHLL
jgi:hypothetical protein